MSAPVTEPLPLPFTSPKAREFMLAGSATFTAVSERTGERFTFKVSKAKNSERPLWFVGVMTGPDNEADYQYLGNIRPPQDGTLGSCAFDHGRKSRISPTAPSAVAFRWLARRVLNDLPTPQCNIYHAGRCGRCGRKLTVPESIISGYGPECIEHV